MIKSTIQYGYGNVFFYTDELKQNWEFVNLNNGTRKMIIKEGAFINYPGIENPEIVMKYYKNNASVINNFGFDSYCIAGKNEKPIIYWCIQKDAEQSRAQTRAVLTMKVREGSFCMCILTNTVIMKENSVYII